jgi:hypothetical protein
MPPFVICEVTLGRETHLAVGEIAAERLLAVVDSHMRKQIAFLSESFLTTFHLTYEWTLSSLQIVSKFTGLGS